MQSLMFPLSPSSLASVQDHLLEMLHFLWLCKSEYKLKPLWKGPSSPGFVTPTTSFSNWAAIILFFFFFFPSAPYSCSLFPMAHEAETFSSVFLISVLLLWCCKGQQAAANGQQEGGSATSLCSLKGTLCVCVPSGTCPVTCLEWIVSHSIRAVWCGQWQTKPNRSCPHFIPFLWAKLCLSGQQGRCYLLGQYVGEKQEVWNDVWEVLCQS